MSHKLRVVAAVTGSLVGVAILASSASARLLTTEPGVVYKVPVTLLDTRIVLKEKRYPRDAVISYQVKNLGLKLHAFSVGQLTTRALKPRQRAILLVVFDVRGRIPYRSPVRADHGKIGMSGYITVY